jgi:Cdc6-like AAA superfamily ATPase
VSQKDQTSLLNLIETGIVTETKYNKTKRMEMKTSIFATSNSIEKIIPPLQSRFLIVKMQAYTYEQLYEITPRPLTSNRYNVDKEIRLCCSRGSAEDSGSIREVIEIANMAKSVDGVDWIDMNLLDQTYSYKCLPTKISLDLIAASKIQADPEVH